MCKLRASPAVVQQLQLQPGGPHLTIKPAHEAAPARCAHARQQQRLRLCTADERLAGRARRAVSAPMLLLLLRLMLLALQPRYVYSVGPYGAQSAFVCCIVFM
jgi:hypothetical protein